MNETEFQQVLSSVSVMSLPQLRRLLEVAGSARQNAEALMELEERVGDDVHCPRCGHHRGARWGYTRTGLQRRRCRRCGRTFNAATGTALARTQQRDVLFDFIKQMLQPSPMSCREAAAYFGIDKKTALRWRHQTCRAMTSLADHDVGGIVEADETFQRESRKGSREWARHDADPINHPEPPRLQWHKYRRRDVPLPRGVSRWQVPIVTLVDRSGSGCADVVASPAYTHIGPVLHRHIQPDAVLCSDRARAYRKFSNDTGVRHVTIESRRGRPKASRSFHIQNVNALHSRLKDFLRPFKGPAKRYLEEYVSWFMFRDHNTLDEQAAKQVFQRVIATAH